MSSVMDSIISEHNSRSTFDTAIDRSTFWLTLGSANTLKPMLTVIAFDV